MGLKDRLPGGTGTVPVPLRETETELARDYVRTALGKGLSRAVVLRRHVLPNLIPALLDSLPPVATALLGGSFAAERVFGLPYFGQLYVSAVLQKQLAVVVVATTIFAALLVAVSVAVELVRLVVDPRARERGSAIGVAAASPAAIDRIAAWAKAAEGRGITLLPITAVAVKPKSS